MMPGMKQTPSEESLTLLPEKLPAYMRAKPQNKARRFLNWTSYLLNLAMVAAVIFLARKTTLEAKVDPSQGYYTPAHDSIEYYNVNFSRAFGGRESPYQGWPNDEIDQRWQDLYSRGSFARVTAEEAKQMAGPTEKIPIKGLEDQYMIGFDVFHQLHCLNMIRQSWYPKRYKMPLVMDDGRVHYGNWMHLDHCVDSLRQYIQCHGDMSAITYSWGKHVKQMLPDIEALHTCRNFEKLHDWVWDRAIDLPNLQLRVVDGKIVQSPIPPPDDLEEAKVDPTRDAPPGWNYTVADL